MSWLFSRALAADCLEPTALELDASAQSKPDHSPLAYLLNVKTMGVWARFPSGMTCIHLTEDLGEELLTLYREGFRANPSVMLAEAGVLQKTFGQKC